MNDGMTKRIESFADLVPGCVIRRVHAEDGSQAPFSDAVVIKIMKEDVKVMRPYAVGTCLETSCPFEYMGIEEYTITLSGLQRSYVVVLDSKGRPYTMVVGNRI